MRMEMTREIKRCGSFQKKIRTFLCKTLLVKYPDIKEIINCAAYQNGHRVADVELNKVHKVLEDVNQFVWIGLHEPSEGMLQKVQEQFNLHNLTIEDAHTAHQRTK